MTPKAAALVNKAATAPLAAKALNVTSDVESQYAVRWTLRVRETRWADPPLLSRICFLKLAHTAM